MGKNNKNSFNGKINFNGTTQIIAGDVVNNMATSHENTANYEAEPIWRSPFTMAVLSWIGLALGIAGLLPLGKIVKRGIDLFSAGDMHSTSVIPLIAFGILFVLCIICWSMRRITKNQTRHPLFFNFAISGYDKRLTLEKIHIEKCPQCGGKMKYYGKATEWIDRCDNNGRIKREVTKRSPALECKRNAEHYYWVDPAEDKIK